MDNEGLSEIKDEPCVYKIPKVVHEPSLYENVKYSLYRKLKLHKLKPILIIPGFGDCILLYKRQMVWPWFGMPDNNTAKKLRVNWDNGTIRSNYEISCIFKEDYSKFNTFIKNLKNLGYKNKINYKVLPYDFRTIGEPEVMLEMAEMFTRSIFCLFQNTSTKVTIISYDLGCILTQIFLNNTEKQFKEQFVARSIMLNPTIGGNIYSLQHSPTRLYFCFSGIQMQLPHPEFYGEIVDDYFTGLPSKIRYFYEKVIKKFQEKSFIDPRVKIIILRNLYSPDLMTNCIAKFKQHIEDCTVIDFRIKNDDTFLNNKKLLRKLMKIILNYKMEI